MPERLETLIRKHEDAITRDWADRIYSEPRIGLATLLSYEQLVDHLPDMLGELARLIEQAASEREILETVRRLRSFAQVRFYQGALIDEVARELMVLRQVLEDFLWREAFAVTEDDCHRLRRALWRVGRFVDEMLVQTVLIYGASLRPPVQTRSSVWPPPRRRRTDRPFSEE
ncbi:MAG: RsbRD N-terminal domain-containing protein [Acidobacteria bacterium]|nr:RsbRD N-terminal domain-containing protein [Acidobacteriota bacterium]